MSDKDFSLAKSARPFSLVVAVVSCGLGIFMGLREMASPLLLVAAVLLAGLLLQVGVNLINDKGDLKHIPRGGDQQRSRSQILFNYRLGLISFGIAIGISLALVVLRGWVLLAIGVVGVAGAFAYTTEPINYKRRGMGVMLVFWLMGVLMVEGAYLAVTGELSWSVFWHSLPVSCLISLLLLSNEIRDYERDQHEGVATLTVRIGLAKARHLYWILIVTAFALGGVYAVRGELPDLYWLLLPLPLLWPMVHWLYADRRRSLPPWTGRFLLLFGIGYALAM